MNITGIDIAVIVVFLTFLTMGGAICKRFIKSGADWTVAGRNVGIFIGLGTSSAEGLGLLTIVAFAERGFRDGWGLTHLLVIPFLIVGILYGACGFVTSRFSQSEVVTVPEYCEKRFSKGVRLLLGVVLAFASILNLAVSPS